MTNREFTELKTEIAQARRDLVDMLLYEDRHYRENQQSANRSAKKVSLHLVEIRVPTSHEVTLNELKSIWESFNLTRESEIIPALLAGDRKKAQHLAAGIQKERLNKIYALICQLEK